MLTELKAILADWANRGGVKTDKIQPLITTPPPTHTQTHTLALEHTDHTTANTAHIPSLERR